MKKSLFRGVLQKRNSGNRLLRKEELKGEGCKEKVLQAVNSGGAFR